jgi:plasmid stabilization system protein ParE
MAMKLRLSPRAQKDLKKIFVWYAEKAGLKVADQITNSINNLIKVIPSHPNLGYIEPSLKSFPQSFRTCIDVPNYKIIYWVEEDIVKVATVFDCRQRPEYLVQIFSTQSDWLCEPEAEYKKLL